MFSAEIRRQAIDSKVKWAVCTDENFAAVSESMKG